MAMFGGMFGGNGFGLNFGGGDFGGGRSDGVAAPTRPGFNDPGGLGEKLGMAGSAILGAYNGGAGALNLDALRKLHQPRGGGVQPAPPIAMPDTHPSNSYLQIDPLTGQYRSILPGVPT